MAATKRLTMRFRDSNDRIVSFTVNPPVDPVDLTEVDALMDLIINTDTFYSYTGGVSFTVNPPVDPVDLTEVDALMDLIINTDTFYSYTGGALVEKIDVRLHSEEIDALADYE